MSEARIEICAACADEHDRLRALILDAYDEFAPMLAPEHWARMRGNLILALESALPRELLVAHCDGELAGTVSYYPAGPRGFELFPDEWAVMRLLAVRPGLRGRGCGRALAEACLTRAGRDGAAVVGLHTGEMMTAATGLYERLGFVPQRSFAHHGVTFRIYTLALTAQHARALL